MRPRMGKTLYRYFLAEIGSAFLAGLGIFVFILFVVRIIDLVDMVFSRGVPAVQVLRLIACIFPSFLEMTLPMAMLLGVVVAFGRMAADGELLALLASGINVFHMLRPVFIFAGLVSIAAFLLAVHARPWGKREVKRSIYEIAKTKATAALRPRYFNNDFDGMVIYIDRIDNDAGLLKGVMLADERDSYRRTTVFAEAGRIVGNEESRTVYLQLHRGTSISFHAGQESYDRTDFRSLEVNLDIDKETSASRRNALEPGEMDWQQLLQARKRKLESGDPAIAETIEFHRKFSVSAASILLAFVGLPLGLRPTRSVRTRSLGVSLAVILVYYVLLTGSITAASKSLLPAGLALWIPNAVMAVAGAWMLYRSAREQLFYPSVFPRAWSILRKSALGGTARGGR